MKTGTDWRFVAKLAGIVLSALLFGAAIPVVLWLFAEAGFAM